MQVGLQHDMIALMLQPNGSKPQLNMPAVEAAFAELRLELQFINPVYRPPTVQLRPKSPNFVVAWSKFAFFHVTKYSKIVVLDTDIIVMRDPSNLARIPAFAAVQTGCNEGPPDFAHLNAGGHRMLILIAVGFSWNVTNSSLGSCTWLDFVANLSDCASA